MAQENNYSINKATNITTKIFEDEIAETENNISINQELAQRIANALQTELYHKIKQQNNPGYQNIINDMHEIVSNINKNGVDLYTDNPFEKAVLILTRLLEHQSEASIRTFLRNSIAKILQDHDYFKTNTSEFYTEEMTEQLIREYQHSILAQQEQEKTIIDEVITAEYNRHLTFATNPASGTSNPATGGANAPASGTTGTTQPTDPKIITGLVKKQNTIISQLNAYSMAFTDAKTNLATLQDIKDSIKYAIAYNEEAGLNDGDTSLIGPSISNDQLKSLKLHFNSDNLTQQIKNTYTFSTTITQADLKNLKSLIHQESLNLINSAANSRTSFTNTFNGKLKDIHAKITTANRPDLTVTVEDITSATLEKKQDITTHDNNQDQIINFKVFANFELETRKIHAICDANKEFITANTNAKARDITTDRFSKTQNQLITKASLNLNNLNTTANITNALSSLQTIIDNYKNQKQATIVAFPQAINDSRKDLINEFKNTANNTIVKKKATLLNNLNDLQKTNSIYAPLQAIERQLKAEQLAQLTYSNKITGVSQKSFKYIKRKFKKITSSTIENFKQNNNFATFTAATQTLLEEKYNLEYDYNVNYLQQLQIEEFLTEMNAIATTNGINPTTFTASIKTTFQNNIATFKRTLETTTNIIFNNNKYQKLQGFFKALDQNSAFNLGSIDLETLNILRTEKIITHNTYFTTDDQTIIKNNEDSPKKDEYFVTHTINNFNGINLKTSIQSKINGLQASNIPADIKSEVEKNISKVLRNKFNDLSEKRKVFTNNIKYSLQIRGEIQNAGTEIEDLSTCLGKLYNYFTTSSQNFEQMYELDKNIITWLIKYFPSDHLSLKAIRSKAQLDASQQTICSYNNSWIARANQIYFNMDATNDKYIPSKKLKKLMLDNIAKVYTDNKYTTDQEDYHKYAIQKNKLALKTDLLKFIDYLISVKSTLVGISSDNTPLLDLKKFNIKIIHEAHKNPNITPNDNYFFVAKNNLDDFKLFATTMFNKSFKITSNNFGKNKLTNLIEWLRSSKKNLVDEIMLKIHNIDNKPLAVIAANNNATNTDDHINDNIDARKITVENIKRLQRIRWDVLVIIRVIEHYKNTKFSIANIANTLHASFSVPILSTQDRTWITGFIDETTVATLDHLEDAIGLHSLKNKLDNLWDSWQAQQKNMKADIQKQIDDDLGAIKTRIANDKLAKHGATAIETYTDEDIGYSDDHEAADRHSFTPYYNSIRLSKIKTELSKFKGYINQILKNDPSATQQIKINKNLISTDLIRALNYKFDSTDSNSKTVLENSTLTQETFFEAPTYMQDGTPADIPPSIVGLAATIPQTAKDFYYLAVNSLQGLPKSKKYKLETKAWTVTELKHLRDALELKTSNIWSKQAGEIKQLQGYSTLLQDNLKFKSFAEEYKFYYEKIMEDLDNLEKVNEMVSLISELKIKMERYHTLHNEYPKTDQTSMTKSPISLTKPPISLKLAKASLGLVERLNDLNNLEPHNITTKTFSDKLMSDTLSKKEFLDFLQDNAKFTKLYNRTVHALEALTIPESDGIKQSLVGKNTMVNDVNIAFDYNLRIIDLTTKIQHVLKTLRAEDPIKYGNGIISITGGKIIISNFNSRRLRFETNREEQKSYIEHYSNLQEMLSKFCEAINYIVNTFFVMSKDMDYNEYTKLLDTSTFKKPTPIEKIIDLVQDPRIINLIRGFAIREHSEDVHKKAIKVLKEDQKLFTIPTQMKDKTAVATTTVNDNEWKNQSDYYIMNNQLINKGDDAKLFDVKGVEYNRAEFKDMLANAILLQKVITNQSQSQSVRIQDTELFITNTIEALVEFIKAFKRLCDLIIANAIL